MTSPTQETRSPAPAADLALTARALATSAALAAALAVPLHFVVFTERIFEAEKAGLLRLLSAVALAGLGAAWLARRRDPASPDERPSTTSATPTAAPSHHPANAWRHPLAAAAILAALATTLATLLSLAPATSLLGSYDRGQGLATTVGLLGLFAAASLARRSSLATALALAACPAALYGLVQRYGLDPLPWLGDVVTRVSGPAGSSVLLAAHLAMALPFVLLSTARAWRGAASAGRRVDPALAAWMLTAIVTSWALVLTGSRGPALGLAGGAVVALLAWAATTSRRRTALAVLLLAAGLGIGVLGLNANRDRLGPALDWPLVGRLALALDRGNSTTRVRLRLWEGSVDALDDRGPFRLLVGTGPETMDLTWAPHYPPILAHDEPRGLVPDRAHSLLLDTLLTEGLLGALAVVALFTTAIGTALGLLGLMDTRRDARTFLVAWLGGGIAAGGLTWALDAAWDDQLALAAPAAGLGATAGLAIWLASRALGPPVARRSGEADGARPTRLDPDRGFALAALATLVVAWLELQVGFAVTTTRLLLWLTAGGLLGAALVRDTGVGRGGNPSSPAPSARPAAMRSRPPTALAPTVFAPLVLGATLVFTFARPGLVGGGAATVAGLLVAGVIGAAAVGDRPGRGRAVLVTSAVLLTQLVAQGLLLSAAGRDTGDAVTGAVGSYGLYALVLLGAVAWRASTVRRGHRDGQPASTTPALAHPDPPLRRHRPTRLTLSFLLALAAALLALPLWLLPTTADALYKEGRLAWEQPVMGLARRGESGRAEAFLDRAIARYEGAVRLAPHEPRYRLRIGYAEDTRAVLLDERLSRALSQAGQADARDEYDPGLLDGYAPDLATRRDAAFATALVRFDEAERRGGRAPGSPSPVLARARALRLWGDLTREPEQRAARLAAALATYERAAATVAPRWPEVLHEAATTALLAGDPDAALLLARRAIVRDPLYYAPWKVLATAQAERGLPEDAALAWARYLRDPRNAGDAEALRGHLGALLAAGRPEEAVTVGRRLVIVAPNDARAYADLAVALEGAGQLTEALENARAAASLALGDPELTALVKRLERR